MNGKVLKVVDNCDVEVLDDRTVIHCNEVNVSSFGVPWDIDIPATRGVNAHIFQNYIGGWLNSLPDEKWKPIFNDSRKPNSAVERDICDEDREYTERLSRYERGEREPGEPPRRRDEINDPF